MIQEFDNFLTAEECSQIIGLGESSILNYGITTGNMRGYRKAKVNWLSNKEPLLKNIRERVSELSNLPIENQERPHFVKYGIGGEYKTHRDCQDRLKTALIYLNEGYVGGETEFPIIGRTLVPKTGKLVIWENYEEDETTIKHESLHAGRPIELGTKYILVIWIKKDEIIIE